MPTELQSMKRLHNVQQLTSLSWINVLTAKKINANPDHLELQSLVSSSRGAITSFFIVSIVFQGKYQEAKQPYKHRTVHMATTFLRSEHCDFQLLKLEVPTQVISAMLAN